MKKLTATIIFVFLFIPHIAFAGMPDIVSAINTGLTNLSAEKKTQLLDDYCVARGYTETIKDAEGKEIQNPQTKKQFMNQDVCKNFIKIIIDNYRKQQGMKKVIIEELNIEE